MQQQTSSTAVEISVTDAVAGAKKSVKTTEVVSSGIVP